MKTEWETSQNKISKFEIHQSCYKNGDQILRKQKIDVAAFDDNMKQLWVEQIYIDSSKVTIIDQLIGKPAPSSILVNWDDWGYGQFEIDEVSIAHFKENLSKIENPLARNLIYSTVFMMVREGKMAPNHYINLVKNHIMHETSQEIFQT
mgnify:CR=1 FL=1